MAEHEISQAAYDRLAEELAHLRSHGRIELADRIERAREHGDLKENAEYHAAKEEKAKMEARVAKIAGILERATIIDTSADGVVAVGSVVHLRYDGDDEDEVEKFLVGSIEERHDDLEVVSPSSPLGERLIGVSAGESVTYEGPTGAELTVEVVHVE